MFILTAVQHSWGGGSDVGLRAAGSRRTRMGRRAAMVEGQTDRASGRILMMGAGSRNNGTRARQHAARARVVSPAPVRSEFPHHRDDINLTWRTKSDWPPPSVIMMDHGLDLRISVTLLHTLLPCTS